VDGTRGDKGEKDALYVICSMLFDSSWEENVKPQLQNFRFYFPLKPITGIATAGCFLSAAS
jgi:hypothetical protein